MLADLTQAIANYFAQVKARFDSVDQQLTATQGDDGHVLFIDQPDTPLGVSPGLVLNHNPVLVESTAEADFQRGESESFGDVFNDWYRISHLGRGPQPADETELNAWSYDEPTDRITCTVNSTTLIGFIAPEAHEEFVFEVTVKSTSTDDDLIGVCFAYTEVDGVEYTLTALRTPGGAQGHPDPDAEGTHQAKLFDVYYEIFHTDNKLDLGSTNGGLQWGDGVVDDTRNPGSDLGAGSGWDVHPAGCRIRVTRSGDVFTLETSDLGSTTYVPTATVTVDLNAHPELAKFKGPQRYGYVCYSQPDSTWDTHTRPVALGTVIDITNESIEQWDGSVWQTLPYTELDTHVLPGRFYHNATTERLYFAHPADGILPIRLS